MKFGKTLAERTLKEWKFYYVDYKQLKQILKTQAAKDETFDCNHDELRSSFDEILSTSEEKLSKFYYDKESWAIDYFVTLQKRVQDLKAAAEEADESLPGSPSSLSSSDEDLLTASSPTCIADDLPLRLENLTKGQQHSTGNEAAYLKEAYRKMGASQHFQAYIYAKKSLVTFQRELDLLLEFLDINTTAYSKILKKFDKQTGTSLREARLAAILENNPFLKGEKLQEMRGTVDDLIEEVNTLKPRLPLGWENRKVYTIGCFDLFHRGHQNVLMSLREFGAFIVAGIHDDESYYQLKKKYTIDNLETRMKNVKPYVDQIFVIPSTDPLPYIKMMISDQDIANGSCCYARGDDMLNFPAREFVESVMPVHFVPRTEACSSTLIRTIYHSDSAEIRAKAAFAKTRYDGKPIDENGNVLQLQT
ncbi:cytidyltransferase like protein [Nitzschia inconspicua]|uniref:Cytidyltransferase like protein n=1 Tax=Nitzschia inconspicua TaxID=303405 RepID=A0A9K3PSC0_9STRA|nr:cytidyltransferase like protein [Nitzschia inconspicua]